MTEPRALTVSQMLSILIICHPGNCQAWATSMIENTDITRAIYKSIDEIFDITKPNELSEVINVN